MVDGILGNKVFQQSAKRFESLGALKMTAAPSHDYRNPHHNTPFDPDRGRTFFPYRHFYKHANPPGCKSIFQKA
jgi:hypothetical protein